MAEIIAHRGASHEAPENTLAAVLLAWRLGADAVEVDVHLTRDQQVVVMHDESAARTTGVDWRLCERTLEELRGLDVGSWRGERWAGERIPTLAEVLATVPEGRRVLVEVKCGPKIVPELLREFDASDKVPQQLAVISFDADVVRSVKQARCALKTYWLCVPRAGEVADLIQTALSLQADGIDAQANESLDAALMSAARRSRLMVYAWSVDDPAAARRLVSLGVDGITTNSPAAVRTAIMTE